MFSHRDTSLKPPNTHNYSTNSYNQRLLPTNPSYDSHYSSAPNVAFYFDNQFIKQKQKRVKMDQRRLSVCANFVGYTDAMGYTNQSNTEQRRLSDGPSLRLANHNLYHPSELSNGESYMLKQKNSSLNMLLDSTSSMMRTASTTFHCLIGSARRASYCGQPDPTIQLSPHGNSGSLYLLPTTANSNESSLSNASHEDHRRTVTIYDGRIPATPTQPTIPFELMTPIDLITQTIEDPVESFVQIVLEEPDDRPPIIHSMSSSSSSPRNSSSSRRRHRSNSPRSSASSSEKKITDTKSLPTTEIFNSSETYYQPPDIFEPMDFSFLEPVLRGESAAPPPSKHTQKLQQISSPNSSISEDSPIDIRSSSRTITIVTDGLTLPELFADSNNDNNLTTNSIISSSRLKVPSSID
ncbi:unnamed protein product [Rotaria sordida]|uniref:Uncharacterized protein n=1 Tax=Rotaria sordida TaxID=392033 RepID=A0A814BTR7_9BILA|nr:unnamed protein product [Rotaria sordida]